MVSALSDTCQKIAKNAEHGGEIVRRLLDFSRFTEGFVLMDVKEAIESSVRLWECKHDLRTDFEATCSDRRAEGDSHIRGAAAELAHSGDNIARHPADRPAPPGMTCTYHPSDRIGKEDRNTIRGERAQRWAGTIADEAVILDGPTVIRVRLTNSPHGGTMNMLGHLQLVDVKAGGTRNQVPVRVDGRAIVAPANA
jgi:hypothetical protein